MHSSNTHLCPDDFMDLSDCTIIIWLVETLEMLKTWQGVQAYDKLYKRELERLKVIRIVMKVRGIDEIQINNGKEMLMISFLHNFEYRLLSIPLRMINDEDIIDKAGYIIKVFNTLLGAYNYDIPSKMRSNINKKIIEYAKKEYST
jgi:hypothetical protein